MNEKHYNYGIIELENGVLYIWKNRPNPHYTRTVLENVILTFHDNNVLEIEAEELVSKIAWTKHYLTEEEAKLVEITGSDYKRWRDKRKKIKTPYIDGNYYLKKTIPYRAKMTQWKIKYY